MAATIDDRVAELERANAELRRQLDACSAELKEARDQQTATAEVLQVINSSPGDLAPVFDAMLEKAVRLCDFAFAALWTYDGTAFHPVALHGMPPAFEAYLREHTPPAFKLLHDSAGPIHFPDVMATEMPQRDPEFARVTQQLATVRTLLLVPLRKDAGLLGAFVAYRQEVRPFSDKQISLLQNFAAQAVIAMENARLITETREALEQQTATAEVLQVINSSPGDLAPVFDAILEKAMRLCDVAHGHVLTIEDGCGRVVAARGEPEFVDWIRQRGLVRPLPGGLLDRVMRGERLIHRPDAADTDVYRGGTIMREIIDRSGMRTSLGVALRSENTILGAIVVNRQEVRPFTDKQIALLQNFSAQAVIAMENARLLTETREALEQQTATAEVLRVINSSPGDLAPVFEAMLDKAMRLCEAAFGTLWTYDGACVHAAALYNVPPVFAEFLTRAPHQVGPDSAHGRLLQGEPVVHIPDIVAEKAYRLGDPIRRALVELGGGRTLLAVPLRKDNGFLGDFVIYRQEARPFSDKQIALLQNFAAQAVIAMENARLLTETREALEQQTATAEVLQVINSSPGDLVPVFDAMLEKAMRLCEAAFGVLWAYEGNGYRAAAVRGAPLAFVEFLRQPLLPHYDPGSGLERALRGEDLVVNDDMATEEIYRHGDPLRRAIVDLGGARSHVLVALRKDETLLGAITIYRQEVRPFSDKQIALLQNFAAQAVIAMENARLITETREALEQQTATAEVLQVINSSPGDVQPTFDAIAASATRLCEAASGAVFRFDGSQSHLAAHYNCSPAELDALRATYPLGPSRGSVTGRAILTRAVAHVADIATDPDYALPSIVQSGMHAHLSVPMLLDGDPVGAITVARREAKPFSEAQIELLRTFAAQAVIAMENARLITETREALEQQTATAEVLQVINSSPGDLAPVFDAMLEKAMRLCRIALGALELHENGKFRAVAVRGVSGPLAELLRQPFEPPPESPLARLIAGEKIVQITDMSELARLRPDDPRAQAGAQYGLHTALFVPLRKDAELLGQIVAFRQEERPFSEKEIALLQNFAAQAVIAMENARLLTETREALEQQTATAEVLQVINSSPGDLAPVFDIILEKAHRLCGIALGSLELYDGERFRSVAEHGLSDSFASQLRQGYRASDSPATQPLLAGNRFTHIADAAQVDFPIFRSAAELEGIRTVLFVPLRRDDALLGMIASARREVRPFSEKQIALLQNFAAQAVIAMENARLITETREALEQQTATAEVLQVINSSPGDLAPVFDAMLERAVSLCAAVQGVLWIVDGKRLKLAGSYRIAPAFIEMLRKMESGELEPPPQLRQLMAGERIVHVADVADLDIYRAGSPVARAAVESGLVRTLVWVALVKEGTTVGAFAIARREVRPFSDKQIALLQNFAAQAVIAMENARLITETREALEQQTATAEVLQVINSSPGDLAPVFDAMLEKATRLCEAAAGTFWIPDGEQWHPAAIRGMPEQYVKSAHGYRPSPNSPVGRIAGGQQLVHITDFAAEEAYRTDDALVRAAVDQHGIRTLLSVPLRKERRLLGVFSVYRREVRPFSDKQIALVQNFAAQAVIAMENARLLTETREALEQQTATAEVLQVINSSPGDLAPVFDAILEKAHSLCGAAHGALVTYDGEHFRAAATHGLPAPLEELLRTPFRPTPIHELLLRGQRLVHIADQAAVGEPGPDSPQWRASVEGGARTLLLVPLRKDGALLGNITAARWEVRPFSEKEIALLESFAAQAVIAMENARLLSELRQRTSDLQESLEYQTATSDVLKVISQSNFDLGPVLENVIETALRLCRAHMGSIFRLEDGRYRWAVGRGLDPAYQEIEMGTPILAGSGTLVGRAAFEGRAVQIADAMADPFYAVKDEASLARARTMLGVPLLREGAPIGVIAMARDRVESFSEKEVALVTTFADQAVIAIENARLVNDLRQRTHDLQESLEYQTAISDVLRVISSSAFDLETVLQTVVTTAVRLCRADSATIYRNESGEYRWAAGHMLSPEYEQIERAVRIRPGTGTVVGRASMEGRTVHMLDAWTDPLYGAKDDARVGGVHTMIGVPLLRENAPIGVIGLARRRVEAFSEREIALVTTFADQAVIAIENARLIDELRDRTDDLGRSVEELKMLSEVGQAVSSTLDLRAVLSTILTASLGVTMANAGAVFRYGRADRAFRLVEVVGWDEALTRSVGEMPIAESESAMGEAVTRRTPIQLPDIADRAGNPLRDVTLAAGFHSALIVPLVGAERIFGAIVLMRQQAGEFPAETVRLMQTLASQSVLAIQNARLFREIADKSEQLALASEHKSQFLANMSHELRTPLNAILGYAELLVDGIYGVLPEKAQGVLERVQNNGKHLLALINDVLDLAKIEAGQLTLTLENYSLPEVVRGVVTATEPLAAAKGLKFTAIVQEGMPMAHGDARRVSQVLLNLAGNAIKFTDAGEVEINASAANGQFVLTVRDTGPGIADADQERIFGEFQQIENTDTRKKGGTGLGLAISKRMVEMQGGMISVDSVLGAGSTFRVVLPVHVEPALEEVA
jgi:GAF domain-containing protein